MEVVGRVPTRDLGACTVRLPAILLNEVQDVGERTGLTKAAVIAVALDIFLQQYRHDQSVGGARQSRDRQAVRAE